MLLFYVTFPDETTARRIADDLLQKRLIACANLSPIWSNYCWKNEICNEQEWTALLKTRTELEARVESALLSVHPYQTPCIVRWEARANEAYEIWIHESTEDK